MAGRFAFVEFVGRQPHRFVKPHRHHAFLGIAENQITVRRVNRDLIIEEPFRRAIIDANRAVVSANHFAVRRYVFVLRPDHAFVAAGFDFGELLVHGPAGLWFLAPEIDAVHLAVLEPERAMMLVIVFLVVSVFHRPVARHRQAVRSDDRVKERPGDILEMIFAKQLAVDLDAQPVVEPGDLDALFRVGGAGRA